MNNAGALTSLAAHSSVCDVCQGFGDLNNPRGYILENEEFALWTQFVYIYVHHANIEAVIASAGAGCEFCELIRQGLGRQSSDGSEYSKDATESSPTRDSTQPDPIVPGVQPDEDILTPSQLAELARREGIITPDDLDVHGHGRVILQFESPERDLKYGPRDEKLHREAGMMVRTTSGLICDWRFFNSSGISLSHEE